ncbi:MAG: hypothetical protein JWO38_7427 [Gemmataceae bacterium]|nr:hypothetical protein [Gemmataceae bacterium]
MRPQLLSVCLTAAVATCFLAASPRASAGSVKLNFDSTASSSAVKVQIGSGSSAQTINAIPGPYYWHEVSPSSGSLFPNPTTTFCSELTQQIATGNSYTYTTSSVAVALNDTTKALAISELYAGHYSTAWEKSASFTGSTDSTAFQLALWALIYDSNTNLTLTGSSAGNLQVISADPTAISTAQTWLDTLGSQPSFASVFPNSQLVWLSNPWKQDQLTLIPTGGGGSAGVPAPPGAVLAGIGFVGLIGRARWLKRNSASA